MGIYKAEDFTFIEEDKREMAARQFNIGAEAACHTTKNDGSWSIPDLSTEQANSLVKASIEHAF